MLACLTSCPPATLSERQAIEDVVLCRLAGLDAANGGFVRHLGPYNGDDAGDAEEDMYRHLVGKAPAILVTTGTAQSRGKSIRATDDEDDLNVEVLVVSTHWRDPVDRVRARQEAGEPNGDRPPRPLADPGAYHMLYCVRRLLMGRHAGLAAAGHLRRVGEAPLVQSKGMSVWRAIYRVNVHLEQELAEVERDEWDSLRLAGTFVVE